MVHGVVSNFVASSVPLLDQREIRIDRLGEPGSLDRAAVGVDVWLHQRSGHRNGRTLDSVIKGQGEELGNIFGVHALGRLIGWTDACWVDAFGGITGASADASNEDGRGHDSQGDECSTHDY